MERFVLHSMDVTVLMLRNPAKFSDTVAIAELLKHACHRQKFFDKLNSIAHDDDDDDDDDDDSNKPLLQTSYLEFYTSMLVDSADRYICIRLKKVKTPKRQKYLKGIKINLTITYYAT